MVYRYISAGNQWLFEYWLSLTTNPLINQIITKVIKAFKNVISAITQCVVCIHITPVGLKHTKK